MKKSELKEQEKLYNEQIRKLRNQKKLLRQQYKKEVAEVKKLKEITKTVTELPHDITSVSNNITSGGFINKISDALNPVKQISKLINKGESKLIKSNVVTETSAEVFGGVGKVVKSAVDPINTVKNVIKENTIDKVKAFLKNGVVNIISVGISAITGLPTEVVKQGTKKAIDDLSNSITLLKGKKKVIEENQESEESEEDEGVIEWYGPRNPEDDGDGEVIEWYGPWNPPDDGGDDDDDDEGVGHMTMREFLNKKLNELPTQLLIREKSGSYRVVSIEVYKNMLISIFKDKLSRNKDAYEGSSASEFLKVYDEFNRDYDSAEGEETVQINYENLFDWLAF